MKKSKVSTFAEEVDARTVLVFLLTFPVLPTMTSYVTTRNRNLFTTNNDNFEMKSCATKVVWQNKGKTKEVLEG